MERLKELQSKPIKELTNREFNEMERLDPDSHLYPTFGDEPDIPDDDGLFWQVDGKCEHPAMTGTDEPDLNSCDLCGALIRDVPDPQGDCTQFNFKTKEITRFRQVVEKEGVV